jgi:hypothetical protein
MPIFSYFAVAGTALLGLLFMVDATLAPPAVRHTSSFYGLPNAMARGHGSAPPLVSAPAPEPDMNSPAVLAAAPMPAAGAPAPAADAAMAQAGKPAKRKQIARKPWDGRHYDNGFAFDRPWQDNRRWVARNVSPWSTWR